MKNILIIGGSKGIGKAIVNALLPDHNVINISRTDPEISHDHHTHHSVDVLKDDLPDIDELDGLVYCPGSINLKPVNQLAVEDFERDFQINVIGAVKG